MLKYLCALFLLVLLGCNPLIVDSLYFKFDYSDVYLLPTKTELDHKCKDYCEHYPLASGIYTQYDVTDIGDDVYVCSCYN